MAALSHRDRSHHAHDQHRGQREQAATREEQVDRGAGARGGDPEEAARVQPQLLVTAAPGNRDRVGVGEAERRSERPQVVEERRRRAHRGGRRERAARGEAGRVERARRRRGSRRGARAGTRSRSPGRPARPATATRPIRPGPSRSRISNANAPNPSAAEATCEKYSLPKVITIVPSPRVTAAAVPNPGSTRSAAHRTSRSSAIPGSTAPNSVSAQTIGVSCATSLWTVRVRWTSKPKYLGGAWECQWSCAVAWALSAALLAAD